MTDFHSHHHAHGELSHEHSRPASTLSLISLAHGINHAQAALKPLVYPLVLREFGFGYSELGIMLGVASAVGGFLQLGAGALGRTIRRHLLLGVGNASVGICFLFVGLAQSFPQFFFWTVMSRVGGAAQHPVGAALLSHHFKRKRLGLALATHFTAGNLGTAFIPFVAALLIGLWGWRVTTILFAVPAIIVGLALCVWLKDPRENSPSQSSSQASFIDDSKHALANSKLRWILLSAAVAAGGSGHGILSSFLPLYLSHRLGLSAPAVGFIFTLLMAGSIVGPLLGGRLLDRFSSQQVILGGYTVAALATASLPWAALNSVVLHVVALVLGTSAFGVNPILQTLVAQVSDDRNRDMSFALFYTATFLAGALWSPAIGYLSDRFGLEASFAAMALSFMAASLCVLAGRFKEVSLAGAQADESWSHG
ncbi:MAG: MFS transporter [Deltaproteobacteria bacterium]|nr:MFS transporter [Deltaproteobacteria bacterium]